MVIEEILARGRKGAQNEAMRVIKIRTKKTLTAEHEINKSVQYSGIINQLMDAKNEIKYKRKSAAYLSA